MLETVSRPDTDAFASIHPVAWSVREGVAELRGGMASNLELAVRDAADALLCLSDMGRPLARLILFVTVYPTGEKACRYLCELTEASAVDTARRQSGPASAPVEMATAALVSALLAGVRPALPPPMRGRLYKGRIETAAICALVLGKVLEVEVPRRRQGCRRTICIGPSPKGMGFVIAGAIARLRGDYGCARSAMLRVQEYLGKTFALRLCHALYYAYQVEVDACHAERLKQNERRARERLKMHLARKQRKRREAEVCPVCGASRS